MAVLFEMEETDEDEIGEDIGANLFLTLFAFSW